MQDQGTGGRLLMATALAAACVPLGAHGAHAARESGSVRAAHRSDAHEVHSHSRDHAETGRRHHGRHGYNAAGDHVVASRHGISCVPFARNETGIEITGNAADWWRNAAGVYARGSRPEIGSVLNFRSNPHMRLGHVAAVKEIVDSRHLIIDHANWAGPGGVSRNIDVVDVSPNNDWTAVRVEVGHSGVFGSIYPTYGFIYARNDGAAAPRVAENMIAPVAKPIPVLNAAPRDLRPMVVRASATRVARYEEVAEAPVRGRHGLDLSMPFLSIDAPNRSLR